MLLVQCLMGVEAACKVQSVRQRVLCSSSLELQAEGSACVASLCSHSHLLCSSLWLQQGNVALSLSMAGLWRRSDLTMQAPQCTSSLLTLCWYCILNHSIGLCCWGRTVAWQCKAVTAQLNPGGAAGAAFRPGCAVWAGV